MSACVFLYLHVFARSRLRQCLVARKTLTGTLCRALLIKCSVVLGCVILCFFLHPVTHVDPAFVAILGAVWLLVAFDLHRRFASLKVKLHQRSLRFS